MQSVSTLVQVPRLPPTLHLSQFPPQAVLQQYPSMQFPVLHSIALVHVCPFDFFVEHVPDVQ